jgi:hypothetical protein
MTGLFETEFSEPLDGLTFFAKGDAINNCNLVVSRVLMTTSVENFTLMAQQFL